MGVLTWLLTHRELVLLLMSKDDLDAVRGAKGSWQTVGPQVSRLTSSCQLGKAVFSFAGQLVNSSAFGDEVGKLIEEFIASPATSDSLIAVQHACEALVKRCKGHGVLAEKRKIKIVFLGHSSDVAVQAPSMELDYKFNAALKQFAIGKTNGVEALF